MKRPDYSIMVVDSSRLIHEGLKNYLESDGALSVDAIALTAKDALIQLETFQPNVLIIDHLLGDTDGLYLIQRIHSLYPKIQILIYSMSCEHTFAERAALAGARAYVMKSADPCLLRRAIYRIMDGHLFFNEKMENRIIQRLAGEDISPHSSLDKLSNREMDIFRLVGEGKSAHDIGKQLKISKNTVDAHRINIRKKLSLLNGKALDRFAYEVIIHGRFPEPRADAHPRPQHSPLPGTLSRP